MIERGFIDGEYQDSDIRGLVFVAGKRNYGKTTCMVNSLRACLGGCIFFDSLSKHHRVMPEFFLVSQPGELEQYLLLNRERRFRALYQPRAGNLDQHFAAVCSMVRALGNMIFGIDELDKLTGPRFGDSRMCPEFYHLVNYGRHCEGGVSMIATARRAQNVPRGFTGECESMRLFRLTEPASLEYFEDYMEAAAIRRVRSLPRFEYILWPDDCESDLAPDLAAAPIYENAGEDDD